jgi:hypothetical protein
MDALHAIVLCPGYFFLASLQIGIHEQEIVFECRYGIGYYIQDVVPVLIHGGGATQCFHQCALLTIG